MTKMAGSSITKKKKLSPKQLLFIKYYLVSLNATEAAINAGYSKKTSAKIGFENLQKPEIQAAIQKAMDTRGQKIDLTAERVLREFARVAFSDIRKVMEWNNDGVRLMDSDEIDDDNGLSIQSITETTTFSTTGQESTKRQIKMYDKIKALELCGRHLGILDGSGKDTSKDRESGLPRILELVKKCGKRKTSQ